MTRRNRRSRRGFTFAELLVVVLLLALIFGAVLPACARRQYGGSNRVKCASNLRQIGQAILLYCNENGGKYPRLLDTTGPVVTPTWGTGAAAANPWGKGRPQNTDVTAALFLLLRTQDITSEVFVCPSSYAERDTFGDALSRSNFSDVKKNLSYSYQNPYPNDGALERKWKLDKNISAEYAVASDINPGTAGIDQNVLAVVVTMSAKEMK